jgi:UDP-glucose 4-epimerase
VVRDFIHVRDLARLFHAAATSPFTGTFNASSGMGISISELLAIMIAEFGVMPQITRLPDRACDVPASVLSCEKAKSVFGWKPLISIERGIQEVGRWLVEDVLTAPLVANRITLSAEIAAAHMDSRSTGLPYDLPLLDHGQTPISGSA